MMINWCWRWAYWVVFRLARIWWWLRHPDHDGALVAIWFEGRVLTVRQSYRRNLSWPGGGLHRGEEPKDAARRELAEELGLVVAADDLTLVRAMVTDWDFRRDHVRVYALHLRDEPRFIIDDREIVGVRFMAPQAVLAEPGVSPVIRAYLEDVVAEGEKT